VAHSLNTEHVERWLHGMVIHSYNIRYRLAQTMGADVFCNTYSIGKTEHGLVVNFVSECRVEHEIVAKNHLIFQLGGQNTGY
jgi:hypothetical protein